MGANFGDVDSDNFPEFYLGTGNPDLRTLQPNTLTHNVLAAGGDSDNSSGSGGGSATARRFEDVTFASGVGHLQKGHGVAFADLDNDGDQDIFAQMGGFFTGDFFKVGKKSTRSSPSSQKKNRGWTTMGLAPQSGVQAWRLVAVFLPFLRWQCFCRF